MGLKEKLFTRSIENAGQINVMIWKRVSGAIYRRLGRSRDLRSRDLLGHVGVMIELQRMPITSTGPCACCHVTYRAISHGNGTSCMQSDAIRSSNCVCVCLCVCVCEVQISNLTDAI